MAKGEVTRIMPRARGNAANAERAEHRPSFVEQPRVVTAEINIDHQLRLGRAQGREVDVRPEINVATPRAAREDGVFVSARCSRKIVDVDKHDRRAERAKSRSLTGPRRSY